MTNNNIENGGVDMRWTEEEMKEKMNKIHNMDCLEFMKQVPDNYFDCVVTSPPYDGIKKYKGYSFDFESIAIELYRTLKDGGVIIWNVADQTIDGSETLTSFKQALFFNNIGLRLHDTMIYRKLNYTPLTHRRYEQEFEYMFCFSKGSPKTFNPIKINCKWAGSETWGKSSYYKTDSDELTEGEKQTINDEKIKGNIFEYRTGSTKTGKIKHPAMFPTGLAYDQILSWTNPKDIVFDPFMGSGTTAVESTELGRKFIGTELSIDYCDIANKRLSKVQTSMFAFMDGE